jgi:hypothetical protein
MYSVHPAISKIENIGFNDKDASNTIQKYTRFQSILDNSMNNVFVFKDEISLNPRIIKQFIKVNSLSTRFFYKISNFLN